MFKNYRSDRCYIIAEIGGNFTTFDQAQRLIDEAAACGVDAVKLQTYRAETVASKRAVFDMENTGVASQYDLFKKYEIDPDLHREVFRYAETKQLDWFSTPSHELDVDLLEACGVGAHKIGSDDAVNLPFLRYVAKTGKPLILSTGMCTLEEVKESVVAILEAGCQQLLLLHAITSYPTHPQNVNLAAMQTLMATFPGIEVGYSDHTLTPVASLCAVAMGARVIERHFTWDKNADGPDHILSADPPEMKWLVDAIRAFEMMRGSGVKEPAASEATTRRNNRKSVVLLRALKGGDAIAAGDIAVKRPGYGIAPKFFPDLFGRRLSRDLDPDSVLTWEDLA
ncbi:N-acetylneuraminate synthase family protein [Propionivibrio soli]|uniref:N-acetylneuraminate synthase family protein n=1 Tax=Propionivibrio soli TaxID=2976531 RepID=UPI0021E762E0|nr:N-acetylneuraminate synthase family protein [Propionivibrio soli]